MMCRMAMRRGRGLIWWWWWWRRSTMTDGRKGLPKASSYKSNHQLAYSSRTWSLFSRGGREVVKSPTMVCVEAPSLHCPAHRVADSSSHGALRAGIKMSWSSIANAIWVKPSANASEESPLYPVCILTSLLPPSRRQEVKRPPRGDLGGSMDRSLSVCSKRPSRCLLRLSF